VTSQTDNGTDDRPREVEPEFLGDLQTEVTGWRAAGIISSDQARRILGLYVAGPGSSTSGAAGGRLITALGILGSILVGVGVILAFAANWDGIAREAKIALVLVATLTAYGAGYWLRYARDYDRIGLALILLGTLLYGSAIHLIAQAYHVPVDDPDLMALWFLGVIPLAYATGSQAITALSLVLFLSALGFRLQDWIEEGAREVGFVFISAFAIFGVMGLMLNGLGRLQSLWRFTRVHSGTFQVIGLVTALGAIYLLGFRHPYEDYAAGSPPGALDHNSVAYWVAMSLAGAIALVGAAPATGRILRPGKRDVGTAIEAVGPLALLVPLIIVTSLPVGGEVAYPIAFNLILLVAIFALLTAGYLTGRESFVNVGLVFFSIDAITRYFVFSWDLLDRSFVFIGAGLILLVGGYLLERGRRSMILKIQGSGHLRRDRGAP
jgi:uncharacterized membrane protein